MTRTLRILKSTDNATAMIAAAPPPEAVALESDFVVILAALLCALICVVGLVAVARCAWLRRGTGTGGSSPRQALANKGLKKKVLQSLPKFAYVDSNPSKWVATPECAICLSDFAAGDEIRVLPQCGHGFHVGCIDTWLGSHSSCPSCRQVLVGVTRCQKCGRFPAASGGATRMAVSEPELKSREDNAAASNNNINGGSCSNSNSGFLP
ncbi:RING-H2 finger protein ATL8-like [Gastrolobium bilobum]|uniref:RING-H2 finger protein ATL8-like n=1 Tax=Gastrolobium bilobum TaxID=150636 RepID=UPI002AB2E9A4|nr:RING-H2 finger protein ATL8-like [Gastrolobium bilobum]